MSGGRVISLDVNASSVATSTGEILNDGVASATITVTLVTNFGDPFPGRTVTLSFVSGTGTLTQPVGVTNAAGQVTGSVVSTTDNLMVIKASTLGVDVVDTAAVSATGSPFVLPAANRFIDNLEGVNKDADDPTGINVDGFSYVNGAGIKFSIVRSDGYIVISAAGAPILSGPFPSNEYENAPDGTGGTHAFRGRYPANSSSFAEQEFDLGADYPTLWMRYWIRVPINYAHTNVSGGATNNKWFAFWQDGYSTGGQGGQGVFATRPGGSNTLDSGTTSIHYNHKAGLNGNVLGGDSLTYNDFIEYPADRGRWMQVAYQMQVSSGLDVADGIVRFYRRWEDETAFTLIMENTSLVYNVPTGFTGFHAGYFLGAANSWYAADTEFLIDRIEVSTTSLVP